MLLYERCFITRDRHDLAKSDRNIRLVLMLVNFLTEFRYSNRDQQSRIPYDGYFLCYHQRSDGSLIVGLFEEARLCFAIRSFSNPGSLTESLVITGNQQDLLLAQLRWT